MQTFQSPVLRVNTGAFQLIGQRQFILTDPAAGFQIIFATRMPTIARVSDGRTGLLGVFMSNSRERTVTNFEQWMPVKDYVKLIAHSSKDYNDSCQICTDYIERPTDASLKLKIFLRSLVEGGQIGKGPSEER